MKGTKDRGGHWGARGTRYRLAWGFIGDFWQPLKLYNHSKEEIEGCL